MTVRVSTDWTYHKLQALVIENELLRAVVLPELGGKIWSIVDKRSDREFLWHNPRLAPLLVPTGTTYDDVFFGGWDELFPNDIPEVIDGEQYPDHGELWTTAWSWTVEAGSATEASIVLSAQMPISGCSFTKTLTMSAGSRALRVSQQLTNNRDVAIAYLWKHHIAVDVSTPARVDLGARSVCVEDFGNPRARAAGGSYSWPTLVDGEGVRHDMRNTLPVQSQVAEFQYATELESGWCAVTYSDRTGIGIAFDREVFRSCWLFASYGGWRGLQVLVLEPCTGYPASVNRGLAAGTHQVLAPGETVQTSLTAVVYDGVDAVAAVHPDGRVEAAEAVSPYAG